MVALPELLELLSVWLVPFTRFGAFMLAAPIFGSQLVPMRVRLLLTIALSVAAWPVVRANIDPVAITNAGLSFELVLVLGHEVFVGVSLGFACQLFFHLFVMAGQIISMQMGLGFAAMVDPTNGVSVGIVSQLFMMLVILLFLAMNGHLVLFEVLIGSYSVAPGIMSGASWDLALLGGWLFGGALLIALPAVTALLMVNLTFGVLTRSAPQLNIFSIGFPMTLLLGVVIIWVSMGNWLPQFDRLAIEFFEILRAQAGLR